jgi:beta-glucanase (GH16 family)
VQPTGIAGRWTLKFADDFRGSSVDLTKWKTSWPVYGTPQGVVSGPASGLERSCYDPARSSVARGVLSITAIARDCRTYEGYRYAYASDQLSTFETLRFTYGVVEARINIPPDGAQTANWPQLWLVGYQPWPQGGEIDVVEGSQGKLMVGYHAPGVSWNTRPAVSSYSGWHTFAVNWQRGSITYFIDGRQVARHTGGITSRPQYLNVGLGIPPAAWSPAVVPSTMQVDYVRIWQ